MAEKIKAFFKLVRWFHEVAVIVPFSALYLVISYYDQRKQAGCYLSLVDFSVICLCVQTLVAAGCVLNDIVDRQIDKINKPKTRVVGNAISLKNCWIIFFILTLMIILLSAYITAYMFWQWSYISAAVYILSLIYDCYLKKSPLFGNILIALITAFIPLVILFFAKECISSLHNQKIETLIYLYAVFVFLIIVPRELSLDISDMEGDKACGCKTLPIVIGVRKAKGVVIFLLSLIVMFSFPLALYCPYFQIPVFIIDMLVVYYIYILRRAVTRIDYIRIGRFLWFIMIFGLVAFTIATVI